MVPGTTGKFACGGLWAELKTLKLAQQICNAELVTYRQREKATLFLNDVLRYQTLGNVIFVISWGFDVARLAQQLKSYNVVYHAHSTGYHFVLPTHMPVVTVSRNTMGYWGQRAPHSLIYYLPNQISDEFQNLYLERKIDVLVQARKSSQYLLRDLVPALQHQCRVEVVSSYVEDLAKLFNQAKVYLYDSAEYWAIQGVSEGFGLQPMEALASGCQVFSSVNGGLSDYLDPGFNCYKIAGHSRDYDVDRILQVVRAPKLPALPEAFFAEYRAANITQRFKVILEELNQFFDHKPDYHAPLENFTERQISQLRLQRLWQKLQQKLLKAK